MSQEYTPVDWVDETTSQQGTLINAERLDQMQTAHHYADGFEEVDAIPTEDPGVDYHKVVYCTADSTFYRWDGTQWTADIDEDTKHLLDQEIARATQAEGVLRADITAEATARANADTALGARIDAETEAREAVDRQISEQIGSLNGETLPLYRSSSTPTIQNAIAANEGNITNLTSVVDGLTYDLAQEVTDRAAAIASLQASKADKATTLAGYGIADAYTEAETDTLLASKADVTALTDGSVTKLGTADVGTDTKPIKLVGGVPTAVTNDLVSTTGNQEVGGRKTFTTAPITLGNSSDLGAILLRNNNITLAPMTGGHNTSVEFRGQNDALLARLRYRTGTGDQRNMYVDLYDKNNTAHVFTLCQLLNGAESYPALDGYGPMVRTTGNQAISGIKDFSGTLDITGIDNVKCTSNSNQTGWKKLYEWKATVSNREVMFAFIGGAWCTCLVVATSYNYGTSIRALFKQLQSGRADIGISCDADNNVIVWQYSSTSQAYARGISKVLLEHDSWDNASFATVSTDTKVYTLDTVNMTMTSGDTVLAITQWGSIA